MHAFDVLGDPVRRRILDLLADGERPAGAIVDVVADEFGITQPAVAESTLHKRPDTATNTTASTRGASVGNTAPNNDARAASTVVAIAHQRRSPTSVPTGE